MRIPALLTIAVLMCGCGDEPPPPEERLRPVRTMQVSDNNAFLSRTFSGTSKSSLESRLSFKVSGTLTELPVQIGQRLNEGDTIAALDPTAYRLQVQQAAAALIEAEANNRRASANYERTKGLYANDNASLNDLDAARAQAESAEAVVESANKALEIARLNLSYTTLTAEAECSIASLSVEVNENVQPGQTVALVSCGDTYEVTLNLPESLIGAVDQWTPVTIQFGAIPERYFQGEVSEVAVASTGAAAFPVVIRVLDRDAALRSGLAADVTFQFDATSGDGGDAFVLPVAAVVDGTEGTFVFVTEADANGEGVVRRQPVTLGELTQDGIEVTSGLNVGDRVVTAGTSVIRDGQRVLVPAP